MIAEDTIKDSEGKRQVSVLARNGHLPFAGKRYIDNEDTESDTLKNEWDPNPEPTVLLLQKRYVGALAKTGDLARFKQSNDKRDDVDTLIDELLTAEELRRIRLGALREELLKQEEELESEELDAEKRSLASLARTGGFPFRDDKRSIASMARMGYLRDPNFSSGNGFEKRGISSLARNGDFPYFGKRGGVSSVMRNGFSYQKRNFDSDLDSLLLDEYDVNDKRNVASLARNYNLPFMGKRNIASFARNGWLHGLQPNSKKSAYYYWDDSTDESKRNLPSLLRNRLSPFSEGKRYLGAFVASNGLQKNTKNWNTQGKRDMYDDDNELTKRYVSSLLKQGPLPISTDNVETNSEDNQSFSGDEQSKVENTEDMSEEKRHIGSFLANKSFVMRKKKSITSEDQFGEQPPTISSVTKPRTDENKMNNDIQQNHRQKREAFAEMAAASDEYPMPVMQNTEILSDYDEGDSRKVFDESTRKKRYFGKLLILL